MLITDHEKLKAFQTSHRLWQGIPSIEVTKRGRTFLTFYSGGTREEIGNFAVVIVSDDGKNFSEPIVAAVEPDNRCFDPCLWIDPLGRLWFTWCVMPEDAVYGAICDDPDAEKLTWHEPVLIGHDVMMNKPTVLSSGEWIFPIAVWAEKLFRGYYCSKDADRGAFVYRSVDQGRTFQKIGGTIMPQRSFDEHMILELEDERLAMYVRTYYGIGVSYSFDRGKTWTEGVDSGLGGPCSRFFIRRLKSGRVLLINHVDFRGRNNLTAMLSEDDGRTWPYRLLLDGRDNVSYPDATQTGDGAIHITYDRERGGFLSSMDAVYASAREILTACITEEDIIAGRLVNAQSYLSRVCSKLGRYAQEETNPFGEAERYSADALAALLSDKTPDEIVERIFELYPVHCANMHRLASGEMDALIDQLRENPADKTSLIRRIVTLVRAAARAEERVPLVERVKAIVRADLSQEMSAGDVAQLAGVSLYYMLHQFKRATGITISDYRNELRLTQAKRLLVSGTQSMTEIAHACGFGDSSYFAKVFLKEEGVSPSEYRRMLQKAR